MSNHGTKQNICGEPGGQLFRYKAGNKHETNSVIGKH